VARTLARVPLALFRGFRSVHAQNLARTGVSPTIFGAANSLYLPTGIPFLHGLADIVVPMRAGAIGHAIAFAPGNGESEEGEQIDKAQARA
jgi:hypothetical protein